MAPRCPLPFGDELVEAHSRLVAGLMPGFQTGTFLTFGGLSRRTLYRE
jgi:hypothetical protein